MIKCLKPGGMFILIEGDFEFHQEDQTHLSPPADPNHPDASEPGQTWTGLFGLGMCPWPSPSPIYIIVLANLIPEALRAQSARGCDFWKGIQRASQGLWDHPSMDPDSCGVMTGYSPLGPWPESEYSCLLCLPLCAHIESSLMYDLCL